MKRLVGALVLVAVAVVVSHGVASAVTTGTTARLHVYDLPAANASRSVSVVAVELQARPSLAVIPIRRVRIAAPSFRVAAKGGYAQTGNGGVRTASGNPAIWRAWEVRDGVRIRVAYEPATGRVRTAFPDSEPARGVPIP